MQPEATPVERVRLGKEEVTDERTVTEEVRKERIEAKGDIDRADLPHNQGCPRAARRGHSTSQLDSAAPPGPTATPVQIPDAGSAPRTVEIPSAGANSVHRADASTEVSVPRSTDGGFEVQRWRFPVLLYIAWREYAETLLSDFLLARLHIDDEDAIRMHAQSSQALALLIEHIETPLLSDDPGQLLEQATM